MGHVGFTIPEPIEVLSRLIILIIFLEKNELLGIDKWLCRVEIQGGLQINGHIFLCVFSSSDSTINQAFFGIRAIRDIASKMSEMGFENRKRSHLPIEGAVVDIKIFSTVMNIQTLKDAKLISGVRGCGVWNVVLD